MINHTGKQTVENADMYGQRLAERSYVKRLY